MNLHESRLKELCSDLEKHAESISKVSTETLANQPNAFNKEENRSLIAEYFRYTLSLDENFTQDFYISGNTWLHKGTCLKIRIRTHRNKIFDKTHQAILLNSNQTDVEKKNNFSPKYDVLLCIQRQNSDLIKGWMFEMAAISIEYLINSKSIKWDKGGKWVADIQTKNQFYTSCKWQWSYSAKQFINHRIVPNNIKNNLFEKYKEKIFNDLNTLANNYHLTKYPEY